LFSSSLLFCFSFFFFLFVSGYSSLSTDSTGRCARGGVGDVAARARRSGMKCILASMTGSV
jgi:hypothetical protein